MIDKLHRDILSGDYVPGDPREFWVYEPKPRLISALPFVDRVVQHAIFAIINPIFERTMLPQSYACREGMGVHKGAMKAQALIRKLSAGGRKLYVLKTDFSKFFHSVDRATLWDEINKKISCRGTLNMLEKFTPKHGVGIPIGNLTSQLWANVYGNLLDRFLHHKMQVRNFVRYMDDLVVFFHDKAEALKMYTEIKAFSANIMRMRFSKWSIRCVTLGVNFLGYRIFAGYKLLRRQSVVRAKRKIRRYSLKDPEKLKTFIPAWLGHAQWADSHNLITYLRRQHPCLQN